VDRGTRARLALGWHGNKTCSKKRTGETGKTAMGKAKLKWRQREKQADLTQRTSSLLGTKKNSGMQSKQGHNPVAGITIAAAGSTKLGEHRLN
jgi:hypothetical protein